MGVNLWVQRADLSVTQVGMVPVDGAVEAFEQLNWEQFRDQWQALGDDGCPPGIGFDRVDGGTLHISLQEGTSDRFLALVGAEEKSKILGIFSSTKTHSHTRVDLSADQVREMIATFTTIDPIALLAGVRDGTF